MSTTEKLNDSSKIESNAKINNTVVYNLSPSKITLSNGYCDKTFKNVLRADESNVYNEHKMIPVNYKIHNNKRKDVTKIFDDNYKKKEENTDKKGLRFAANYLNGNLKTNIIFNDQHVSKII
jgi:hypothetical protein